MGLRVLHAQVLSAGESEDPGPLAGCPPCLNTANGGAVLCFHACVCAWL